MAAIYEITDKLPSGAWTTADDFLTIENEERPKQSIG
jgi:hypothetical protein